MFKRTANDLGLDQVLNIVASGSLSPMGAKLVRGALPVFDRDVYLERQAQVESAVFAQIYSQTQQISASVFPDLSSMFDNIVKNPTGILEGTELYDAAQFIQSSVTLRKILNFCVYRENNQDERGNICDVIEEIDTELLYASQEVFKILDAPGTVKENYPTLKALREKAERLRNDRTKIAAEYMRTNASLMQGENAVLRDSRIVLPVKNDFKNKVDGYVQGASQTGVTVYMEPFKLVDMNNAVILAQQEIELEIQRLLSYLTGLIRSGEKKLRVLTSQVANADFLYSFALWCRMDNCSKVSFDDSYVCNLIKARHPLLKDECVPIDFSVEKGCKGVVLTGPNAGGKTVTMKTVGLFSLINQICGYIPASDGSSLQLFDRVFTDIGDDQSIENQLSTFSGHMKSISFILRSLTDNSLVILDELGSGTDPQEGAALARSILEFCTKKAVLTLTTSHHGVLKQYAYASDNVINASMEFDERTLEPTFRVISGLPGESHAIDTAKRMQLPKVVTSNAQKYMGHEAVKISSIIKGLEIKRKEAEEEEAETRKRLDEIKETQKLLEKQQKQLSAKENSVKSEVMREYNAFIKETRKNLESLVQELREGEINKEKTKKVKEFIQSLESKKDIKQEELDNLEYEELVELAENPELKPGMDVLCGRYKREGTIIKKEKNGKWVVAIGPMKFTFKENELFVPKRQENAGKSYVLDSPKTLPVPKPSLDLRGYRLVEALDAIDNQIEACCVHGITDFSIIHGYGDGILQTGIHQHLKTLANVKDYYFAHPDDGGQGKTYVVLG